MTKLKNALIAGVAALALGTAAGAAQAATISFSFGIPPTLATTEINQTGTLSLFNPALGTLTGVELRTIGTAETQINFTSNASDTVTINATTTVQLTFSTSLPGVVPPVVNVVIPTGPITVAPSGGSASFGPATASSTSLTNAPPLPLAPFIGLGDFTVSCVSLSGLTVIGGGGNVSAQQTTTAGCGAEVIYTYDTEPPRVPAPAALVLFGAGLIGLGAAKRLRRAA